MSLLVVIPARGPSKRLPMKPLRVIAGVSLLHRTIALARRALTTNVSPRTPNWPGAMRC
jgi:3-deoxy-manno-octulosonate cytidylyltransferase (CMP-KDO synthetase)